MKTNIASQFVMLLCVLHLSSPHNVLPSVDVQGESNVEGESDQSITIFILPLIFITHTIGSNSTATLGPSVVELTTFAALSWSIIVSGLILVVLLWCLSLKSRWLVCLP